MMNLYLLKRYRVVTVMMAVIYIIAASVGFVSCDWIDPETPTKAFQITSYSSKDHNNNENNNDNSTTTAGHHNHKKQFDLVFSDEFNVKGRSFQDGSDPRWTALDKNDYTNDALHYYSPNNARIDEDGNLVITTEAVDTDVIGFDDVYRNHTHVTKHFRSAMLQTWNKFCFTGGILEARVTLPGRSNVGGLWPALWLLGNLARHTYVGSSQHIWPWSSSNCVSRSQRAQQISGCHGATHFGMKPHVGRGAPEIDIFEVQPGNIHANTLHTLFLRTAVGQPFMSASYQVAPGRSFHRPGPGWWPGPNQWYDGLKGGINTSLNIMFYGTYNYFRNDVNPALQDYWSDAISYNRQLDESHFTHPHVYRVEWEVPNHNHDGYIHWFLDGEMVLSINGTGLRKSGLGSEISSEPMYILLNTAVSKQWGFPLKCPEGCPCKKYNCNSPNVEDYCGFSEGFCDMVSAKNETATKPQYKIDWIRVYQDSTNEKHKVGCSTPERPTRRYIQAHAHLYKMEQDARPLRNVKRGGGSCRPTTTTTLLQLWGSNQQQEEGNGNTDTCGGPQRGYCDSWLRQCKCRDNWTGPHCLSHDGSDPYLYDEPDKITDVGFVPPRARPPVLIWGLGTLTFLFMISWLYREQMDEWNLITTATRRSVTKK